MLLETPTGIFISDENLRWGVGICLTLLVGYIIDKKRSQKKFINMVLTSINSFEQKFLELGFKTESLGKTVEKHDKDISEIKEKIK